MNIEAIEERINTLVSERILVKKTLQKHKNKHKNRKSHLKDLEESRILIQKAVKTTQEFLEFYITDTVTNGISVLFKNEYVFEVQFVEKRNTTECNLLFIDSEGNELSPLDSCGYGAADIASLYLRISFMELSGMKILFSDEPLRFLSKDKQAYAAELLHTLSEKREMQFFIITHETELINCGDIIYRTEKENKQTFLKTIREEK